MRLTGRRRVFGLVGCAAGAALTVGWDARPAPPAPKATERVVVGPLRVGDWFRRAQAGRPPSAALALGTGPELKVIAADLNAAPVFLIDLRDVSDPARPRFVDSKEFPVLAVAGRATHLWGADRRTLTLSVGRLVVAVDRTTSDLIPERRTVRAGVQLELTATDGLVRAETATGLSERLTYDVAGRVVETE